MYRKSGNKRINVEIVGEGEVLLAAIKYLVTRSALPYQVSIPRGQGINADLIQTQIKDFYGKEFQPWFKSSGPDVIAISENEWWAVECKGIGIGKPSIQRNNFDRALASVVSYYEDRPDNVPKSLQDWGENATVYLGLALPASEEYLKELNRRVRSPLRKKLNLWVLLYEQTKNIRAIAPNEPYIQT